MSFANTLERLRDAASKNPKDAGCYRGVRGRLVSREDLEELLFHFDRLDEDIRSQAATKGEKK